MSWKGLVFAVAFGVGAVFGSPSSDDLTRRAIQTGDWEFLKREGIDIKGDVGALAQRVEAERSVRGLEKETERWIRTEGEDSALRLMILARLAVARGVGGLFDRYDEGTVGGRWADLLFARAWLKGRMGDGESAERDGKAFLALFASDERRGRAALHLARQLIARGAYPEARVALRQGLDASSDKLIWSELTYGMGSVQFGLKEFDAAFSAFRDAAAGVDYPDRAFFNAGLAAIQADNVTGFEAMLKRLETSVEGRERASVLRAEQIFDRSRKGTIGSSELADFLAAGGGGAARADLRMVLALLRHREGLSVEDDLSVSDDRELSSSGRRLALVLRLTRGDAGEQAVDALAPDDWASATAVFMEHAGGAWIGAGELVRAEQVYVIAAMRAADETGRQRSLLLAGVCAAASGETDGIRRAMGHWDAVGGTGGKVALLARLHQGVLQMHLGSFDAALAIFEFVIKASEPYGALRLMAESCVTEVAFRSWERSRSEADAERAQVRLQAEARSAIAWGRAYCRARHRLGQLALATGNVDGAIGEWRELLAGSPDGKSSIQWVEASGFALASILERKGDYGGAAESMSRVAALGGALAVEAGERVGDLRLRGFLPLR